MQREMATSQFRDLAVDEDLAVNQALDLALDLAVDLPLECVPLFL